MIDPILEKNTYVESGQRLIKLGDKVVTWDEGFRLFFTTKLANPHYSPEVMAKTMLINYSVTGDGLANQLLNVVVAHERPDLEEQYAALVTEMSESAMMIVTLEDTLLRELSSSTGNILDNEELIATLDETKTKAEEIKGKLEQSTFTKDEISKVRPPPVSRTGPPFVSLLLPTSGRWWVSATSQRTADVKTTRGLDGNNACVFFLPSLVVRSSRSLCASPFC